jgi:hypothetical protein
MADADAAEVAEGEEEPQVSPMEQAVAWIGFTDNQINSIISDIGNNFSDIEGLTAKDISELADSYAKRTVGDGRIIFGLQRTKRLKAFVHWVNDFKRVSRDPTLNGLDQHTFREALKIAAQRAEIRKEESDSSDLMFKEASPGKLKDEKKWDVWILQLTTMLSMKHGVLGVPLSYVIRTEEAPIEGEHYDTFVEESVARAPLTGAAFEADARQVHQYVQSLTTGEQAEQWIKSLRKEQNGRRDVEALRKHYEGEGNSSRRIAEAERLRDNLHYKSERALPFQTFLTKSQHMFNLFEGQKEAYTPSMKLRFLLDRVQHAELKAAIAALKVSNSQGEEITFTAAANHLASELSKTQDFKTSNIRHSNVSGVTFDMSNQSAPTKGIMKNGEVFYGYLPHWNKLSKAEKAKVLAERERKGIKPGQGKDKKKKKANRRAASTVKKELKEFKDSIEERIVSALKKVRTKEEVTDDEESVEQNAGTSFGGRRSKKAKKDE